MDGAAITGVVLAGGRGLRMGGVDKGLQHYRGEPLAWHALRRLQPQVDRCLLNANRHRDHYARFGVPVLADEGPVQAGPLAGVLTALRHCETPLLLCVPCDCPLFPLDLAVRLAAPLADDKLDLAIALAPDADAPDADRLRAQPVFCLMRTRVRPGLEAFLAAGGRQFLAWTARQHAAQVPFSDGRAFRNLNTLDELQALQS